MKKMIIILTAILLMTGCSVSSGSTEEETEKADAAVENVSEETTNYGSVLIDGVDVDSVFLMSADEAIEAFGVPDAYYSGYSIEYDLNGDNWLTFYIDEGDSIYSVAAAAPRLTYNGQSLEQNLDTLASILGEDYWIMEADDYKWIIDGYEYVFYIPENEKAVSAGISAVYYGEEEGDCLVEYTETSLDPNLYGRWRANEGPDWLYLDENGNADTNIHIDANVTIGSAEYMTWEAENGRLFLTGTYPHEIKYQYFEKEPYDSFFANGTAFVRHEGTEGTDFIGEWCDAYKGADADPYYVFYEDGTGLAHCDDYMSWETDGVEKIYTHYVLNGSIDYKVTGDTMQLFYSNGAKTYTRVGY